MLGHMWLKSSLKNVGCNIRQPVLGYIMVLCLEPDFCFSLLDPMRICLAVGLVVFLYGNASNFLFSLKKPQQKKLPHC